MAPLRCFVLLFVPFLIFNLVIMYFFIFLGLVSIDNIFTLFDKFLSWGRCWVEIILPVNRLLKYLRATVDAVTDFGMLLLGIDYLTRTVQVGNGNYRLFLAIMQLLFENFPICLRHGLALCHACLVTVHWCIRCQTDMNRAGKVFSAKGLILIPSHNQTEIHAEVH